MYQADFHLLHYRQFSPKLPPQPRKTDKVYDFLQSPRLTCVDDLWTQKMENLSFSAIYQMTSANDVEPMLRAVNGLSNVVPEFKGHSRRLTLRNGGNRRLCPFSMCCGYLHFIQIWIQNLLVPRLWLKSRSLLSSNILVFYAFSKHYSYDLNFLWHFRSTVQGRLWLAFVTYPQLSISFNSQGQRANVMIIGLEVSQYHSIPV